MPFIFAKNEKIKVLTPVLSLERLVRNIANPCLAVVCSPWHSPQTGFSLHWCTVDKGTFAGKDVSKVHLMQRFVICLVAEADVVPEAVPTMGLGLELDVWRLKKTFEPQSSSTARIRAFNDVVSTSPWSLFLSLMAFFSSLLWSAVGLRFSQRKSMISPWERELCCKNISSQVVKRWLRSSTACMQRKHWKLHDSDSFNLVWWSFFNSSRSVPGAQTSLVMLSRHSWRVERVSEAIRGRMVGGRHDLILRSKESSE